MLKFIGAIFFIISTTYAGYIFSNKLKSRERFLQDFIDFLNSIKTYIRFECTELSPLIVKCSQNQNLSFLNSAFKENNESDFSKRWEIAVKNISSSLGILKEDKELILKFGENLGTTDVEGQINHIELYTMLFRKKLEESQEAFTQKSKLYKMLGLFSGMAISLVII